METIERIARKADRWLDEWGCLVIGTACLYFAIRVVMGLLDTGKG
jgi:hypothetical protein